MPAKPSQLLPLALLFLQIFSCVLNAAVVGTQGKIIFKDPASNTTTSYSLLFSSFFSNDVVGTNEGVIGGALIFGLVWPVLLFILTWLIQTDKVENSRAKILIVIILNIVSTLALFIVACVGAAGVTGFCQKEASSTGVVTECQAYIDGKLL